MNLKKKGVLDKKGIEMSFNWLFAIIVGVIILFLAIYTASKLIKSGESQIDTLTAKQLSLIFEPMETGISSGKSDIAILNEITRIFTTCSNNGAFGKNFISLSTKGFTGNWNKPGLEIPITNKYLFADENVTGKKVLFLAKPLEMPFKVDNLIIFSTEKYCFINAPEEILNYGSLINLVKFDNCTNEKKVCFERGTKCNIFVYGNCRVGCDSKYDYGVVRVGETEMNYAGNLMYAAIF